MPDQEIQKTKTKDDPYLVSPKTFHLEMPPYYDFDLSIGTVAEKIYDLLSNRATVDAYCIWCDKEGVFRAHNYLSDNISIPSWTTRHNGLIKIEYRCTRDEFHAYHTYYFKVDNFLTKIGQFPSVADFQVPQAKTYRKILGEDQYKEFTRGIGLAAHGVGIGSFVYLRRIFENLIEEAHILSIKKGGVDEDTYKKARMDKKIEILKIFLPEFLVENKILYSILSKGIHELTEKECLQYFETVKIGIEQILDEKIMKKEKAEKAARAKKSIQNVHGEISNTK
ncbi:MAG TPA: short-chain dehydrogenase [Ignavibacteria bacterium]|nr:short-chain dehydrogenase [Ignavibacteria bacterium]